jgi:hypothetical protein
MMSDFHVLTAVRTHLLKEGVSPRVHTALPPKATYPLVLIELEEIWSPYPLAEGKKGMDIESRVKFKVSAYSQNPGMEEAACLSEKMRKALEGATLFLPAQGLPGALSKGKTSTVRFLASVAEVPGKLLTGHPFRVIHQFYDCIVRGE